MKRIYWVVAVASLAIASAAVAQQATNPPPAGGPPRMDRAGPPSPGMGGRDRGRDRGRMGGMRGMGMMQGMGMGGPFGLLEFDVNNDGKVTRAELDAGLRARFAEIDADKDGFVTPQEMRTFMLKRRAHARFVALDADHNGQLSEAEFQAGMLKDRDSGGFMGGRGRHAWGPAGFDRHDHDERGDNRPDGRKDGDHRPHDGPEGKREPGADGPRRMGPMDANRDGKLSYEEFSAREIALFNRADADKNGAVTIAELRALADARR